MRWTTWLRLLAVTLLVAASATTFMPEREHAHAEDAVQTLVGAVGVAFGMPAVLDFGRDTCTPCQQMKPILLRLQTEYKRRADIRIINIDEDPTSTRIAGIRLIPTQIFLNSKGKEVYRHEGFMSRAAIIAKLKQMGVR